MTLSTSHGEYRHQSPFSFETNPVFTHENTRNQLQPKQFVWGTVGALISFSVAYSIGVHISECHKKEPIDPLNCFAPAFLPALAVGVPLGGYVGVRLATDDESNFTGANISFVYEYK